MRYGHFMGIALMLGAMAACSPSHAQIIAQDSFDVPPYAVGGLNGQTVGGSGFSGSWAIIPSLLQDLSVVSPGLIGRPTVTGGNSGDFAQFASGFSAPTGQLFISYDINNPNVAALSSSRLDLNNGGATPGQLAYLGALGPQADFNFVTSGAFGSSVTAQSSIPSVGAHHLVGVLDFTNNKIGIFVDPTAASFYNSNGTNDADATATWTPPTSYTATGYSLVDNLSDQATFDNVVFAIDPASAGIGVTAVPEPGSIALLVGMGVTGAAFLRRRKQTQKAA